MAANGATVGGGSAATLPAFSACEALVCKAVDANVLLFAVPARSSTLLPLLQPASHAYEQRDWRWLHLLQAAALVPSRKVDTLRATVRQALALLADPALKRRFEAALRPLLIALDAFPGGDGEGDVKPERLVLGLRLKDRIAAFLREWVADPIEGVVLRKEHVVAGLRLDDVVDTPVGAGYLRAYRREDDFCTVVYPWGHGFIHRSQVEKAEVALARQLRKRKANEFVPLEHQHLFEQVESLAENLLPESAASGQSEAAVLVTGVDVEEYKALLASLEEEHADAKVLEQDLSFLRRVQALASKTRELYASKRPRLSGDDTDEQQEETGEEGQTGEEEEEEEEDNEESAEDEAMESSEQANQEHDDHEVVHTPKTQI